MINPFTPDLLVRRGKARRPRPVKVRVAYPLSLEEEARLSAALTQVTGEKATLAVEVDPEVLGGISVQVGDTLVDGTLRTRLSYLKSQAAKAATASKEFGDTGGLVSALKSVVETLSYPPAIEHVGTVTYVGDGVARVSGLDTAMIGELIKFPGGVQGMVLNLDDNEVGCVILGPYDHIAEDQTVRATGRIMEVPVGDGLLGRVVDPLGRPLDGKGTIKADGRRPIESPAPGIADREPVNTPLQTGIVAIDAIVPIGRGQRELIIGDRQTGKTTVAIDTILNQKDSGVLCVYVAIGQKASTVAQTVDFLRERGAMDYTCVVMASASDPAPMQYVAPFAGCAMAEHWMYQGKDVLIVYDDLTKHAQAYRSMALLLRRPPGREAYPGDIFYLHGRLLERAAKLSAERGGGSLTALPIVETLAGDISAYIPTNIISITDGQIILDADLFFSGVRPAVNAGLSVSRVGGDAQLKAMKAVASRIRLELAQYRELEAFAQFGTDLDESTRKKLARGERLVELLKQRQGRPMPVSQQVVWLAAGVWGYLDQVPVHEVRAAAGELLEYLDRQYPGLFRRIRRKGTLEGLEDDLRRAMEEFFRARAQRSSDSEASTVAERKDD